MNDFIYPGLDSLTSGTTDTDCSTPTDNTTAVPNSPLANLIARPISLCLKKAKYSPPTGGILLTQVIMSLLRKRIFNALKCIQSNFMGMVYCSR